MLGRSIFRSNKVISAEGQHKKVKLHVLIPNQNVDQSDDNKENFESSEKHQRCSIPKSTGQNSVAFGKMLSFKEGSSKQIKSRSCLKRMNSAVDEDDAKSTKSIKFKEKNDNVYEYSLPQLATTKKTSAIKRGPPLKQALEVKLECCQIY